MTFHEPYHHKHPADLSFGNLIKLFYNGANSGINFVFPISFEEFTRREPEPEKDSRPK